MIAPLKWDQWDEINGTYGTDETYATDTVTFVSLVTLVSFSFSFTNPGPGHPFAQAAFGHDRSLQLSNLLIKQVIRLVNQTNNNIRGNLGRSCFNIRPVGLISHIVPSPQLAHKLCFTTILLPKPQ